MHKDTSTVNQLLISKLTDQDKDFLLRVIEYKEYFEMENKQNISLKDFLKFLISIEVEYDE